MNDATAIAPLLRHIYSLEAVDCERLQTLANDVIAVITSNGRFALKLYNPASRNESEIQWEVDLTLHLLEHGVPVAEPVPGRSGYLQSVNIAGQERMAVLFVWAAGTKPKPERGTYELLGQAAALMHEAADAFTSSLPREKYDFATLVDEQIDRMAAQLTQAGRLQHVRALADRLRRFLAKLTLDYGICHMDLTLDNVHRVGDHMTVFDLDSAGESWRALEPWGVRRASDEHFSAWLEGYRGVRPFSKEEEHAVPAFGIIGDLGNVVWKLGLARSSRGKPLLAVSDLPAVVDGWLEWERREVNR